MSLKIVTGFTRLRDEELDARTQAILLAMTGNAHFATPQPTLQAVTDALRAFQQDMAEAQAGSKAAVAGKKIKRDALVRLLNDLALYVQLSANDDLSIMVSAGFDARKSPSPAGPLRTPENLKVVNNGNRGSVKISVNKVDNATAYVYEFRLRNAEGPWTQRFATTRSLLLEGLQSGQEYIFRVAAVGVDSPVMYSAEMASFVL